MKLRSLTLTNVRRFASQTVTLGPIGDGLTTITAENESGKSTFFDALHALFFFDHGANKKELRSLQPYSGGAMTIGAEIEVEGEGYRIEKTFNLRKPGSSASVTAVASGIILKQADDAEVWIQTNLLQSRKGPVGLLWVRQGMVGVDPEGKGEGEGIEARRDVMSSVRGQIDAVTGGRRMDQIVQQCKQELDAIRTKQGKAKAGSAWKEAEDRVQMLDEKRGELETAVETLSHDLAMKKKVMARLRELQDDRLRDERQTAIVRSQAQVTHARDHAQKVIAADKDRQLLVNEVDAVARQIHEIKASQAKREALARAVSEKQAVVAGALESKAKAKAACDGLQAQIAEADARRRTLTEGLTQARQADRARLRQERLVALDDLLSMIRPIKQRLGALEAVLRGAEVSRGDLERLVDLERRHDMAVEKRKVHFSSFTLSAEGQSALCNGEAIASGVPHLIDRGMELNLPGFGTMHLQPAEGAGQGIEDPEQLRRDLKQQLAALSVESVKAARHLYEERQIALQDQQSLLVQLKALAPAGIEALEAEKRQICQDLGIAVDAPLPPLPSGGADGAPKVDAIEASLAEANRLLDGLRAEESRARDAYTKAVGALAAEQGSLSRMSAELGELAAPEDEATRLEALDRLLQAKTDKVSEAQGALKALQRDAPDLAAAEAACLRAQKAEEEDQKEIALLERELARLNGAIQIQSDGAVEEKLAEVVGKLERATQRAQQFEHHARALRLLVEHLEAARAEAQETYFEPIRKELLPLLQQLHGGIDFQLDADKLLVETITRNGVTDAVEALSGGAYEQIAILTRLAFARLIARQGSHVPIILDDALVHTDDERIAAMFNMLAQTAKDQQIIVLSCRTRAFSDLGGERAFIQQVGAV
ncbi:AAA family ATPase [Cohaesibacter intestini]|uniref:AAA family ATPase n=1 Tax=Cohaesibacter intestini TaxID=2211145 RepID=UPI000DEAA739|nr:AAA family ATPase [Cohaesibacter intestini]